MFFDTLYKMERGLAYLQGKGWGAGTVAKEVAQLKSLMGPEKCSLYIDIGGHRGTYSDQLLLQCPSAEVIIFEPSAKNSRFLASKFNTSSVTVEPFALSNETGEMVLHANKNGSSLASLNKRKLDHVGIAFEHEETVKVIRFDDYWNKNLDRRAIAGCKIDVEGHEMSVLEGIGDAIAHISVVQFEFGGANIDSRTYLRDFWYFFRDNGFDLYRVTPFGPSRLRRYREGEESYAISNFLARNRRLDAAV